MSTNQLNKDKFVFKENLHNVISLCYFILITLIVALVLTVSFLIGNIFIIITSFIAILFLFLKLIIQIKIISNFKKLKEDANGKESIYFYITKSWLRKKHSTFFLSIAFLYINILLIILSLLLSITFDKYNFFSLIILTLSFFLIVITVYFNNQILDEYLKFSKRKIDFSSIELIQTKKEQKIFYKTILYWIVSLTLLIPLLLMIFPKYRNFVKEKIIK